MRSRFHHQQDCPEGEQCEQRHRTTPFGRRIPLPPRVWRHHHSRSMRPIQLFTRLVMFFGFFTVAMLLLIAAVGFLFSQRHMMMRPDPFVFVGRAVLVIVGIVLAGWVGRKGMERIATPLSDLMQAADDVAQGDLNVRVEERGWGPVRRMCVSFNHMVEELGRQDQQRKNLTADVAHELRTPLHIIQGNLEGILDNVYAADEAHINATLDETRQLSRLVEDLRTLSRAEAGELSLVIEDVSIPELLWDVQTSFSGPAEVAGVNLQVHIQSPEDQLWIPGDVGRLDQILSNLVANALRYTPEGGVISLSTQREGNYVRVQVRDTGSGISAEDLPFIFDRFWKGDRARTRETGTGSGLGLAIVQQLVRAHHGVITVQSETRGANHGTTFMLEFPTHT